jgi:hypothetical protein
METVLQRFRKQSKPINLWIHAICLDQSDKKEIGDQVQIMGEIYSQAKKVLVWMGDEDQDITRVFADFRMLAALEDQLVPELVQDIFLEIFGSDSPTAVNDCFHKLWFRRRWVLQEVALSKEARIFCHDQQISWKWLAIAFGKIAILSALMAHLYHSTRRHR